jgi:hypothetical protein
MMKHEEEKLNPGHLKLRNKLRIIGPIILGLGVVITAAGFIDISNDPFHGFPFAKFTPLGMIMLFIGGVTCQFAFMGAVARYAASESAPVGKDTFNYMAKGTQPGVRDITSAIREGLTEPQAGTTNTVACCQCNHPNNADARFCDQCGSEMLTNKRCTNCNNENDLDARFCDNCGTALS